MPCRCIIELTKDSGDGYFRTCTGSIVEGYRRVKVNVGAEAAEYVTHDRATLAEELKSEGWRESAVWLPF